MLSAKRLTDKGLQAKGHRALKARGLTKEQFNHLAGARFALRCAITK
jgi:hypothetical protein